MKRRMTAVLLLVLLCAGCGESSAAPPSPEREAPRQEAERLAQAQLGALSGLVSQRERERVTALLEQVVPLRREREEADVWEKSAGETRLIEQLNRLYERYTAKYIGSGADWSAEAPGERVLAEYAIESGGALRPALLTQAQPSFSEQEREYLDLWRRMRALLPEEAWSDFTKLVVFTDGLDATLAYVYPMDSKGEDWAIAVDPADAEDWGWFTQTVLHEYAHYLTLNSTQVEYGSRQRARTYSEEGMTAMDGSYLDAFYQSFWADYLDDRLANRQSAHFLLRHPEDFVTGYAASDPCEDIAECFTWFILEQPVQGEAVWEKKIQFFYDYPEMVEFREEVRAHMGL